MPIPRQAVGFTLIELLIVVAIIAILAAIAVPNFLEAQVRAKCSCARSDLRSLSVAQEAYRIDWNSYTNIDRGDSPFYSEGFLQLTTPVAYITSLPMDVFGAYRYPTGSNAGMRQPFYEMGTGIAGVGSSGPPSNPSQNGMPANIWMITSSGPDHLDDTNQTQAGFSLMEQNFPWPQLPNNESAVVAILTLAYDSTNGTVSGGQIYRTGGTVPPTRWGQVFFANSSGSK